MNSQLCPWCDVPIASAAWQLLPCSEMSAPYNLPSVSLGNSQTSVALSGRYDRFERKSDRKDPNYQRPSFVPDDSNKYTNPRVDASPNISSGLRRRLLNSAESQKEKNYGLRMWTNESYLSTSSLSL